MPGTPQPQIQIEGGRLVGTETITLLGLLAWCATIIGDISVVPAFDALAEDGINIEMISTSPIRISCVIRKADAEQAVRTIHARFELDRDGARPTDAP